jgi:hypothetical protein
MKTQVHLKQIERAGVAVSFKISGCRRIADIYFGAGTNRMNNKNR